MRKYWAVAAVLLALLLFVGNFHVFTGSKGPRVVPRVSFALSEFMVNEDALRSMPPLIVATRFPLAALAVKADDDRQIEAARKIANE